MNRKPENKYKVDADEQIDRLMTTTNYIDSPMQSLINTIDISPTTWNTSTENDIALIKNDLKETLNINFPQATTDSIHHVDIPIHSNSSDHRVVSDILVHEDYQPNWNFPLPSLVRLFSITSNSSSTGPTFSPNSILSGSPVHSEIIHDDYDDDDDDDDKSDHPSDPDFSPSSVISGSPHSSAMSDYTIVQRCSPPPPIPILPKSNVFWNKTDLQCRVGVKQLTEIEVPYPRIESTKLSKTRKELVDDIDVLLPAPKKSKSIHLRQLLTSNQPRIPQPGETFSSISIQSNEVEIQERNIQNIKIKCQNFFKEVAKCFHQTAFDEISALETLSEDELYDNCAKKAQHILNQFIENKKRKT